MQRILRRYLKTRKNLRIFAGFVVFRREWDGKRYRGHSSSPFPAELHSIRQKSISIAGLFAA